MPNHITNILEFDCPYRRFREIAEYVRGPGEDLGSVDFNRLCPMPEELNIECSSLGDEACRLYSECLEKLEGVTDPEEIQKITEHYKDECARHDPELWELGRQYYENAQKYDAKTWYEWSIRNWGSKWNAYECVPVEPGEQKLEFLTAWSGVPDIVERISERFPDVTIRYGYADEDIGNNTASMIYRGGTRTQTYEPDPMSKEAYELSAQIQHIDLEDFGYALSPESGTYEYLYGRDPDPIPETPAREKLKGEER